MNNKTTVDAILWDFDGTLADSAAKNISITKQIMARVAPELTGENLPSWLRSEENYHRANHGAENWRELYRNYFGMSDADIRSAAPMWEEYQELDQTEVSLFDGITESLERLAHLPMGISSANSSQNILRLLTMHGITSAFRSVVGYEEFPTEAQKPAADPGLKCLDEVLGDTRGKTIVYVGDHVADVLFARNIDERLDASSRVISVAVTYSGAQPDNWRVKPDHVIERPADLVDWLAG